MLTQEQDVELQLLREALHRKEEEVDDMRAQLAFANARMHHHEVFFFFGSSLNDAKGVAPAVLGLLESKSKSCEGRCTSRS